MTAGVGSTNAAEDTPRRSPSVRRRSSGVWTPGHVEAPNSRGIAGSEIDRCSALARNGVKRIAICGASSSGMITAKELLETGKFEVVLFESTDNCGGVYSSPAAYEGAKLTGSCSIVCFGCFPSGEEEFPTYWPIPKYVQYLERFVDHFSLRHLVRFNTQVVLATHAQKEDDSSNELVKVVSRGGNGQPVVEAFHHFICCTGITGGGSHTKATPEWPGLPSFEGKVIHSSAYTRGADFAGKRVLVVGLGESGSDISLLLCGHAKTVCVQTRNGPGYVIPRMFLGRAADIDTCRAYHSIPTWLWRPPFCFWRSFKIWLEGFSLDSSDDIEVLSFLKQVNEKTGLPPKQRFGTKNEAFCVAVVRHGALYKQSEIVEFKPREVVFADGSTFECNVVIFCGGYQVEASCFQEDKKDDDDDDDQPNMTASHSCFHRDSELDVTSVVPRKLYQRIVHPSLGLGFLFIGFFRPGFGAIPPVAEMQARLAVQWLVGTRTLPTEQEMRRQIELDAVEDLEQYGHDARRITALGDFARYMNKYADLIGCQPAMWRQFFTHPRLWWRVLVGQLNGLQFRLSGPGATDEARAAILKLPMMPFSVSLATVVVVCWCKLPSVLGIKAFKLTGL